MKGDLQNTCNILILMRMLQLGSITDVRMPLFHAQTILQLQNTSWL